MKALGRAILVLAVLMSPAAAETIDFENSGVAGSVPKDFTVAMTGRGKSAVWQLQDVANAASGKRVVRLGIEGETEPPAWLTEIPGVSVIRPGQDYLELDVSREIDPQDILTAALSRGARVTQFLIAEPSIEQIFIERVGRPPSDDHHLATASGAAGVEPARADTHSGGGRS